MPRPTAMKKLVDTGENSADRRPLLAMSPAHVSMPKAFSTCSETCKRPPVSALLYLMCSASDVPCVQTVLLWHTKLL